MLVASISQTIVTTALPQIVEDLGGADRYSWVFSAYLLASTVTVPIWSGLSDIYGRRPFLLAGITLFIGGAIASAAAQTIDVVIVARAVQGLGAGALVPLSLATVGDLVPARERGKWQSFMAGVLAVSQLIGPSAGGWIVDHASWRLVFLITVPAGLVAFMVVLATLNVPLRADRAQRLDVLGALLLSGGLVGLLVATVEWGAGRALSDQIVAVPLSVSLVLLAVLVRHERRVESALIPVELLTSAHTRRLLLALFAAGSVSFSAIMCVPLFAQTVLGLSATQSGLLLTPLMLGMIVGLAASGNVVTRTGKYKWALVSGPPVTAVGLAVMAALGSSSPVVIAGIAVAVSGLGIGMLALNLVTVLQNFTPPRHLGAATGATELFRGTGGTIGVAAVGALILASGPGGDSASASPNDMAGALRPVFLMGIPVMAAVWYLVVRTPVVPLRPSVVVHAEAGLEDAPSFALAAAAVTVDDSRDHIGPSQDECYSASNRDPGCSQPLGRDNQPGSG